MRARWIISDDFGWGGQNGELGEWDDEVSDGRVWDGIGSGIVEWGRGCEEFSKSKEAAHTGTRGLPYQPAQVRYHPHN